MRFLAIATLSAFVLHGSSCAPGNHEAYLQRTASAANDHIMLVQRTPPSFGFQRLAALAMAYPDLGMFLKQSGDPDFLAETSKGDNRYLILYYTKSRKAFACRTSGGRSRQVEFSGPYPVTRGEVQTLEGLRTKSAVR